MPLGIFFYLGQEVHTRVNQTDETEKEIRTRDLGKMMSYGIQVRQEDD